MNENEGVGREGRGNKAHAGEKRIIDEKENGKKRTWRGTKDERDEREG